MRSVNDTMYLLNFLLKFFISPINQEEERSKLWRYKRMYKPLAIQTYLETMSIKDFVKVEIIKF